MLAALAPSGFVESIRLLLQCRLFREARLVCKTRLRIANANEKLRNARSLLFDHRGRFALPPKSDCRSEVSGRHHQSARTPARALLKMLAEWHADMRNEMRRHLPCC